MSSQRKKPSIGGIKAKANSAISYRSSSSSSYRLELSSFTIRSKKDIWSGRPAEVLVLGMIGWSEDRDCCLHCRSELLILEDTDENPSNRPIKSPNRSTRRQDRFILDEEWINGSSTTEECCDDVVDSCCVVSWRRSREIIPKWPLLATRASRLFAPNTEIIRAPGARAWRAHLSCSFFSVSLQTTHNFISALPRYLSSLR